MQVMYNRMLIAIGILGVLWATAMINLLLISLIGVSDAPLLILASELF